MTIKPKHDKIFRKSLENPIVAYEFIEAHLPKDLLAIIDSKSLKLENDTFVEPDLTDSISDVLFSAKFNDANGYIYLLLEHQSTPDHFMAYRLFRYMFNICNRYMMENPNAKQLPVIYPLVLYNGTKAYNVPRNLWELFNNRELARQFWTGDHQLVNLHDIPDSEFRKRIWSGILEFFLKHRHERQLLKKWQEIADLLPEIAKVSIGYDYIEMILHYTLTGIDKNDRMGLQKLLTATLNQETGERLMTSLAQSWKEEGIEIGILDGIKIGEAKGMEKGIEKGIEKGAQQSKIEIAKKMLSQGYSFTDISDLTGLSIDDIKNLQA